MTLIVFQNEKSKNNHEIALLVKILTCQKYFTCQHINIKIKICVAISAQVSSINILG